MRLNSAVSGFSVTIPDVWLAATGAAAQGEMRRLNRIAYFSTKFAQPADAGDGR